MEYQRHPAWQPDSYTQNQPQNPSYTTANTQRPTSAVRGIPEFSELVLACRHHMTATLVLGVVLTIVCGSAAWFLTEAPYEAEALIRVRQQADVVFSAQTTRADDAAFVRAQEQLALSPQVLAKAITDEAILPFSEYLPEHDAIEWVEARLTVDVEPGSEVMRVRAWHADAKFAQILCNSVTRAYLHEITERLNSDRQRRLAELERAAQRADSRLDNLWDELNRVASAIGSDTAQSLTIRDEIQLQAYRDYSQQLRTAQLRDNELRSLLADEEAQLKEQDTDLDVTAEEMLSGHPEIVLRQDRLDKMDLQVKQMREIVASDDSPRLQRLLADRQFLLADLEQTRTELRPKMLEQSEAHFRTHRQGRLLQLQQQLDVNDAEKEFLRSRLAEIDQGIVRTEDKNGVQLEISRHAVDRQTRLADSLWQSYEELKIENQSQQRVTLFELAKLPRQASHGRQLKTSAAAGSMAMVMVVLGFGYREWKSCKIRLGDDSMPYTVAPVFGQNPTANANSGAQEAAARISRTCSSLRLMVSSPQSREPRHVLALELGSALATLQKRTLIIDCDRAHPALTQTLAAEDRVGLTDVAEASDWRERVAATTTPGLDFLAIGQGSGGDRSAGHNDQQAIVDNLRQVLEQLGTYYDSVVLSGPSVGESTDSLLIGSQVGQVLFSLIDSYSRWDQLVASETSIRQAGIVPLGAVLNRGKCNHFPQIDDSRRPDFTRPVREQSDVDPSEQLIQADVAALQRDVAAAQSPEQPNTQSEGIRETQT